MRRQSAIHAQSPLEPRTGVRGLGNAALCSCTRHYFAWYLLNVMELRDHVVVQQLRHDDGGTLVRELYGHPDAAIARERIRAAFRRSAPVVALPTSQPLVTTARKRRARAKQTLSGRSISRVATRRSEEPLVGSGGSWPAADQHGAGAPAAMANGEHSGLLSRGRDGHTGNREVPDSHMRGCLRRA